MAYADFRASFVLRWSAALIAIISLAGCGAFDRDPPDAFAVTTHAPLVIPNNFTLPPPRPGAGPEHQQSPRFQAEAVLVPDVALSGNNGPNSPGQQALVRAAGPPAPPNIRQIIAREASQDQSGGIGNALLFWQSSPPPGAPLDPSREAARLRQRGAPTPAAAPAATAAPAKNKSSGLLDWLF